MKRTNVIYEADDGNLKSKELSTSVSLNDVGPMPTFLPWLSGMVDRRVAVTIVLGVGEVLRLGSVFVTSALRPEGLQTV